MTSYTHLNLKIVPIFILSSYHLSYFLIYLNNIFIHIDMALMAELAC